MVIKFKPKIKSCPSEIDNFLSETKSQGPLLVVELQYFRLQSTIHRVEIYPILLFLLLLLHAKE